MSILAKKLKLSFWIQNKEHRALTESVLMAGAFEEGRLRGTLGEICVRSPSLRMMELAATAVRAPEFEDGVT